MNNIIELRDYQQSAALDLTPYQRRNAIRFRRAGILAAVETAVTAAIGVCMVVSTVAMVLCFL
jgi:hypothetical protein